MKKLSWVVPLSMLLLSACGGGGDGSASSSENNNDAPGESTQITFAVTEANAVETARVAFNNNLSTPLMYVMSYDDQQLNAEASVDLRKVLLNKIVDRLAKQREQSLPSYMFKPQAEQTEVELCAYGGSVTWRENDQDGDPGTVHVGDRVEIVFNQCTDWRNVVLNGRQLVQVTALRANTSSALDASLSMDSDVAMVLGGRNGGVKGSLNLDISGSKRYCDYPEAIEEQCFDLDPIQIKIRSNRLNVWLGDMRSSLYQLVYEGEQRGSPVPGYWFTQAQTHDFNGQAFRLETLSRFEGVGGGYPSAGRAKITGKGSALLITALPDQRVKLEIDENGDGVYEKEKSVDGSEVFDRFVW